MNQLLDFVRWCNDNQILIAHYNNLYKTITLTNIYLLDETDSLTYSCGISDIDFNRLIEFFRQTLNMLSLTAEKNLQSLLRKINYSCEIVNSTVSFDFNYVTTLKLLHQKLSTNYIKLIHHIQTIVPMLEINTRIAPFNEDEFYSTLSINLAES